MEGPPWPIYKASRVSQLEVQKAPMFKALAPAQVGNLPYLDPSRKEV